MALNKAKFFHTSFVGKDREGNCYVLFEGKKTSNNVR